MITEIYMRNLFMTLLANMPKDTRNMMTQSRLIGVGDIGTHWKITISGPTATNIKSKSNSSYDYAYAVNYNRQRGPKEVKNYMYVERNIKQVSQVFGTVVGL